MPENAPTLMKPAWPRLSSPEMPTVRFSDTAMTMYTQIGTSCPLSERVILKPGIMPDSASSHSRKATMTMA